MASKSKKRTGSRKSGAKRKSSGRKKQARLTMSGSPSVNPLRWLWRWLRRLGLIVIALMLLWISAYVVFNPPTTPYILSEKARLGYIDQQWVPLEEISPYMARAVVAAEDANFCNHFGFDMAAIRAALEEGNGRGGSTITQQVVKNVYLWHGRSWLRKALEATVTPMVEAVWSKRRIIEVYLNIAEFSEGVFGIEAAARHYFDRGPEALTPRQAALLASVLPNPKARSASHPSQSQRRRAAAIEAGAATILADGRSACFED